MTLSAAKNRPGHVLFWTVGVLTALIPYLLIFIRPEWRASWILEPGRFADNLVIAARHFLVGATLGGWLWFLVCRVNPITVVRSWFKEPIRLNWTWFLITLLIYATHNILLLFNLPFTTPELVSACLGRILTAFVVLSLLWLVAHIASLATPTRLRFAPWIIPSIFPGFLAADALGIIFWKNSLRFMVNKIDEDGTFNLAQQLSAGGFDQSPALVVTGILLFLLFLCGLTFASNRLSQKIAPSRFHFRPRSILLLLTLVWIGIAAEKATGFSWKSRKALQQEQNTYNIHLTPIKPRPGVASFHATWKPEIRPQITTTPTSRPDIFFFMIESTRSDAIAPAHTPFLAKFRDTEAQQLGRTWAASNATHLSWYSCFSGQNPNYWGTAIDRDRAGQSLPISTWIELLEKADYQTEIRGVCDFSYAGMATTNFGSPSGVDLLEDAGPNSPFAGPDQPERERAMIRRSLEALRTAPLGGNFHFLSLDAPHFEYEWPADFPVPYSQHDPRPAFHAYPTADDIQRVKNRYFNALAWTDHLIADFVTELKAQGRYDNAIIIITGDHGEEFHEHGSWFHCSSLESPQTEVPIFIKWPAGTPDIPAHPSASHLDLLPSLLDQLGYPPETYAHLPGRSLLQPATREATQVCITPLTGITGISMAWHHGNHTATFRWKNPWATDLPETIHLDDITGPQGSLNLGQPAEWAQALKEHFPDVFDRFFHSFEEK
ncbi:MAG: sulfatase-like hydrolase/transferase [Verrucomicrobiaceae bacterium]